MGMLWKLAAAAAAAAFAAASSANAAIIIDVYEEAGSVVFIGSGSFDTTGLTSPQPAIIGGFTNARIGNLRVGDVGSAQAFSGIEGPSSFGESRPSAATTTSGDNFGIFGGNRQIYLPSAYQSGAALDGTAIFANATIASLGLTPGQYVYRSANDTLTLNIRAGAAVPEPATWAMMILGMGSVGLAMRRRRGVGGRAPASA